MSQAAIAVQVPGLCMTMPTTGPCSPPSQGQSSTDLRTLPCSRSQRSQVRTCRYCNSGPSLILNPNPKMVMPQHAEPLVTSEVTSHWA